MRLFVVLSKMHNSKYEEQVGNYGIENVEHIQMYTMRAAKTNDIGLHPSHASPLVSMAESVCKALGKSPVQHLSMKGGGQAFLEW